MEVERSVEVEVRREEIAVEARGEAMVDMEAVSSGRGMVQRIRERCSAR